MSTRRLKMAALDAWRRELAAGKRTATTFDALWQAACAEANALEANAAGLPELAEGFRQDAYRIVTEAARSQRDAA